MVFTCVVYIFLLTVFKKQDLLGNWSNDKNYTKNQSDAENTWYELHIERKIIDINYMTNYKSSI